MGEQATAIAEDATLGGDANETFDNMDYESDESKELGKEFETKFKDRIARAKDAKKAVEKDQKPEKEEKEEKKEAKEPDKKVEKKKSDLDTLEDDDDVKEEEKKISKEEKDEKEEKPEDDTEKSEEEKEDKAEVKKLKIRMSDGLYGIESDAKIRVKVDGEFQEVPLQDMINDYSGKTAWDKKFSEIGQEKKVLESEKAQITKSKEFLQETVSEVMGHLQDPEKNPLDALNFLVEKSGQDSYTVWRRTLEANLEEVESLMYMSDVERKAYFLEKKDEFRTKSDEARKAEFAKEESFNQALQKVDSLRQAHGVSEEQFLKALDELDESGHDTNKMSDEQVVDYASLNPHVNDVQDVLEPYEDSIDNSKYSEVVQNLARQLRAKDFTKEQLSEWAKKEFMDEDVKDLQSRTQVQKKTSSKAEVKTPEKLETLDFDEEF